MTKMNSSYQNLFQLLVRNHARFVDRLSTHQKLNDSLERSKKIAARLLDTNPPSNEARVMVVELLDMRVQCYGLPRTEYSMSMRDLLSKVITHLTSVAEKG